jgi:hypothetical protein
VHANEEYDEDQLPEAIAEFAEDLLKNNDFIYKGMENFAKVSEISCRPYVHLTWTPERLQLHQASLIRSTSCS